MGNLIRLSFSAQLNYIDDILLIACVVVFIVYVLIVRTIEEKQLTSEVETSRQEKCGTSKVTEISILIWRDFMHSEEKINKIIELLQSSNLDDYECCIEIAKVVGIYNYEREDKRD